MIELKFPENVYLEQYDVYVKPYLTLEEVSVCIDAIMQYNNYLERVTALDGCILNFCVQDVELDGREYDKMIASGFIQAVRNTIQNIDFVWECVNSKESVSDSIKNFVNELIKFINGLADKIPDVETSKEMIAKLTENIDILQKTK